MRVSDVFDFIAQVFTAIGVIILTLGGLESAFQFAVWQLSRVGGGARKIDLNDVRKNIVSRTILSLDFFVGADIIRTVIRLTFRDLGLLAGIIAIRITLAYFLERELREKLPE